MPIYEYQCNGCSSIFEQMRPINERRNEATCPACSKPSSFKISAPQIKLDPISGDFVGATRKWEKMHKQQLEIESKRELS